MSVLAKLKELKRILDWNLATRSQDILPVLNECIKELEQSKQKQEETPVKIVEKKEIKQAQPTVVIQVDEKDEKVEKVEKVENKSTEEIEKEAKQFLKDN